MPTARQHLLLAIFACIPFIGLTQKSITLRGIVLDANSEIPIEFASVSLLHPTDSTLISGAVTNADGRWEIEAVSPGQQIILQASFIGYDAAYSDVLIADRSMPNIRLIMRSNAQILEEIKVVGRKLTDIHRLDRQAFAAEQFTNATGGTARDIIANLPAVSINGQGEITVRGATGFLMLIDGKPVQTDPATLLAQLPANSIDKIEIITTPGAKYDPDGKAGILNITTKQGQLDGWSGTTNINVGLPSLRDFDNAAPQDRYAADFSANYRSGKWEVAFGADYRRDDNAGRREGYVNTVISDQLTEFPSNGERSHDRENYSGRLSVGLAPTRNQRMRLGVLGGIRTVKRTADILYDNQRRALIESGTFETPEDFYIHFLATGAVSTLGEEVDVRTYFNENLRVRQGDFFISTIDYDLQLSDDQKLTMSALYERTLLGGPTDNVVLAFPALVDTLEYQFNTNDNPLDGFRFNIDYTGRIGAATWESGYQFRYLKHPGDFLYLDRDLVNNRFVENPLFSNGILLRRDVHAAYSQVSGATERLEYSVGLRIEYFDRSVRIDQPDTTYRLDRFSLYPSANFKYQLAEGLNARAGYSRRIDRTTTFKMTPFPEREHNETLEQGDAELLPELTDLFELGLIGNFGDNSAFATVYYRYTTDVINRVNTVFNDTILNRIYTNVGNAQALGLELGLTVYPAPAWRIYLGGNVYNYQIEGQLFGDAINTRNWIYSINATSDIKLFSLADLQLGINYLSERVTAQGRDSRFFNPYLNVRREFPKQRLTVTVQWQNISLGLWNNNQQRITTVRDNFFTTTNYVYETDIVRIGVGYQFTQLKREVKTPKSEFGEKEF